MIRGKHKKRVAVSEGWGQGRLGVIDPPSQGPMVNHMYEGFPATAVKVVIRVIPMVSRCEQECHAQKLS